MNKELLLEKYFERSLSTEEQLEFDRLLREDEGFAATLTFEKNVKKAFILNERDALKQKLISFEENKTAKLSNLRWLYMAASIIIIGGVSIWLSLQQSSEEKLFQTYYQTYPNIVAPKVRGVGTKDLKNKAFDAYDNGEYQLAAQLFDQIYKTEPSDFAIFYRALSLMELKDYKSAEVCFKQFDFNKNNAFTPYFKWYLALTELQTKQKTSAIARLKELSATENPMQNMAKKLLADLN